MFNDRMLLPLLLIVGTSEPDDFVDSEGSWVVKTPSPLEVNEGGWVVETPSPLEVNEGGWVKTPSPLEVNEVVGKAVVDSAVDELGRKREKNGS